MSQGKHKSQGKDMFQEKHKSQGKEKSKVSISPNGRTCPKGSISPKGSTRPKRRISSKGSTRPSGSISPQRREGRRFCGRLTAERLMLCKHVWKEGPSKASNTDTPDVIMALH